jgi:hypothetical protein
MADEETPSPKSEPTPDEITQNTPITDESEAAAEEAKQQLLTDNPKEESKLGDTKGTIKPPKGSKPSFKERLASFKQWYVTNKKRSIPLTVVVLIILVMLLPWSRYKVLGLFIKQQFAVVVTDDQTNKPIASAQITLANHTAKTDNAGKATITAKVGNTKLTVSKKYYQTYSRGILVPVSRSQAATSVKLHATGRQVPITIVNKITKKGVENITIKAAGTETKTAKDGTATLVVPAGKTTLPAQLSGQDYNDTKVAVEVTDQISPKNTFTMTPAGKIYFLSKASGKIDVVKTDLDGTERQTVLSGTGNEDDTSTVLLATKDWKYLALQSRRNGNSAKDVKLYLIDTSNDQLTTMDEGNATFNIIGWVNHRFVYVVGRNNIPSWQPKHEALKAYNADNKQLATLDDTSATPGAQQNNYASESFGTVYAIDTSLIYPKTWNNANYTYGTPDPRVDLKSTIVSIGVDGSNKKVLQSFDALTTGTYISSQLYSANEIAYGVYDNNSSQHFYEYSNGAVKPASDITAESFYKFYPTYLQSPNSKSTLWYEPRDGKNTLQLGDRDGKNGKTIGTLTEYVPYGWYTEDYILVSKKGSELYIFGSANISDQTALKVTDYHKPAQDFKGYGGGYGGF